MVSVLPIIDFYWSIAIALSIYAIGMICVFILVFREFKNDKRNKK